MCPVGCFSTTVWYSAPYHTCRSLPLARPTFSLAEICRTMCLLRLFDARSINKSNESSGRSFRLYSLNPVLSNSPPSVRGVQRVTLAVFNKALATIRLQMVSPSPSGVSKTTFILLHHCRMRAACLESVGRVSRRRSPTSCHSAYRRSPARSSCRITLR